MNSLLEADKPKVTKLVVVYSGRFQPFHKGHYATYSKLVSKFGVNNVYIGTSNDTSSDKSPFNFNEKKKIATTMFGIPSSKIIRVGNPYAPKEVLSKFDGKTTQYIAAVGEKDASRLHGKYFKPYNNKMGYGYDEIGYVYPVPAEQNPISGTDVRNGLGSDDAEKSKKFFLKAYPKFDKDIYKMITGKLNEDGFPGGIGTGLNLPNGYINGAPTGSKNESNNTEPSSAFRPEPHPTRHETEHPEDEKKAFNGNKAPYDPISELLGRVAAEEIFKDFVTEYFGEAENKALDVDISYTNSKGEQKKIKARDALRLPKEHPAHVQASKIAGPEDAPANEPKKKEEPGKAAAQSAKPAEPGQPVKKDQTAQGKTDKAKGGEAPTAEAPPPNKLSGAELKSSAEKPPVDPREKETKQQLDKEVAKLSNEDQAAAKEMNDPNSESRKSAAKNIGDWFKKKGEGLWDGAKNWAHEKKEMVTGSVDSVKSLMNSGGKLGYAKNEETGKYEYSKEAHHKQKHALKHLAKDVVLLAVSMIGAAAIGGAIGGGIAAAKAAGAHGVGTAIAHGAGHGVVHGVTGLVHHGAAGFTAHLGKDLAKHSFFETMGLAGPHAAAATAAVGVVGSLLEGEGDDSGAKFVDKVVSKTLEKMSTYQMSNQQMLDSIKKYSENKPKKDLEDLLKENISESKLYSFTGASGTQVKHRHMCHKVARQKYFQLKKNGKNVKYVEGSVYVPMEYGDYKWIEHAWNLIDGKPVDFAYGENKYKYKGHVVKDEYMNKLPKWMHTFSGPEDICDVNIRVGDEYGNKAYELKENISETKQKSIQHFVEWATGRLKLQEQPKVNLIGGGEFAETKTSLGGYNPQTKEIYVAIEGRLGADILRTIAHEMVHRKQDEMGLVRNESDGNDGSPIENNAHAVAGILMREYGRINKQIYTEDINIDVDKGDTVLMGKFKNKKVVVKDFGKDDHGMPTINGKKATTFRMGDKGQNVFKQDENILTEASKEGIVNYYKAVCKKLNLSPLPIKFGSVGRAGAATTFDTKTFKPEYVSFDLSKLQDIERAVLHEIAHHILLLKQGNPYHNCNKSAVFKKVENSLIDKFFYSDESRLLREVHTTDWHYKAIMKLWDKAGSFGRKKIGAAVCANPRATKNDVARELGYSDYNDITDYTDKLGLREFVEKKTLNEGLLLEGGAYGHMSHPFDDMDLTFGDLKNIISKALNGDLGVVREKTDGQALAISWKNGRLIAARNKSHLQNAGAGAMGIADVASKFGGRGALTDAYNFAMRDLTAAISSLSEAQRKKIFNDGRCFMNLEVIWPTSVNVIPYGQAILVFHNTTCYDDKGTAIGANQGAASQLAGMIKQVNADVQSKYTIQGPPVTSIPKNENLSGKQGKYLGKVSKLQSQFGLSDGDNVANYHQAWWENFIDTKSPEKVDKLTRDALVRRWAFGEKAFRLDKNNITNEKILVWAINNDKVNVAKQQKDNIRPFEEIFLGVGADILDFVSSVLTVHPDKAIRAMKDKFKSVASQVRTAGSPAQIAKLKAELARLNKLGGVDRIVASEGLVFFYGGKTYKLTGTFAPLNQILGIFYA